MPVHDWTKTDAGIFHDFHQSWIISIRNSLNNGVLPQDYYAMAEQVAGGPIPDVITLESQVEQEESFESLEPNANAVAVMTAPPKTQYTHEGILDPYARKATRIAIRHANGDRVVGFIEIVSPGNKQSQGALNALFDKLADAMGKGCHLLVIDLHPPTKRDPRGLHAEFWSSKFGDKNIPGCDASKPLGMSAYHSTYVPKAYFQPFSVGEVLIDMPVFLTQDHYVNVPLEPTYLEAWNGVPKRWRNVIEAI